MRWWSRASPATSRYCSVRTSTFRLHKQAADGTWRQRRRAHFKADRRERIRYRVGNCRVRADRTPLTQTFDAEWIQRTGYFEVEHFYRWNVSGRGQRIIQ